MIEKEQLIAENKVIEALAAEEEIFWVNPSCRREVSEADKFINVEDAEDRLRRFAPLIQRLYPETGDGIIESELLGIPGMKSILGKEAGFPIKGRMFLKMDSCLPVSGSVKARGGIYEVLKFAESIAIDREMLDLYDDYSKLADPEFQELFGKYKISVGSTGNLGLAIGIIGAALGFQVTVHMSADTRQWVKDMLRSRGVRVMEHTDDFGAAVAQGRAEAEADPMCHFVDAEKSTDLFEGYAVAARRLQDSLGTHNITVDENHKLYIYIPCGVGGAPGGITYGVKECFGDNAYCFFAEPTHAPCMTLGLASGLGNEICVADIGIDGKTEADGLAAGRASGFVADAMNHRVSGCYTVSDARLYPYLAQLKDYEGIFIEPSACAAFAGPQFVAAGASTFPAPDENSTQIIWATGGELVPEEEKISYYNIGKAILDAVAEAEAKAAEPKRELTGQEKMEAHVRKSLHENNVEQKDSINGMMKGCYQECSYEDKTLTFAFTVQPWQANRVGNMHGGAICTAFDLTIAVLARFYAGEYFAPTVGLDVKYIRPIPMDDQLIVTAKATATGRRITQLTAEGYVASTGKLAATAASVYLNVDTVKERQ